MSSKKTVTAGIPQDLINARNKMEIWLNDQDMGYDEVFFGDEDVKPTPQQIAAAKSYIEAVQAFDKAHKDFMKIMKKTSSGHGGGGDWSSSPYMRPAGKSK